MAKDDPENKLTAVGPGAEETVVNEEDEQELPQERERESRARNEHEDERDEEQEDDEDSEGQEDERAGHSEDDEPGTRDERRREKNRRERKKRKEQRRRDHTELNFLRQRNEQLERQFSAQDQRITQSELVAIDGRIQQVEDQIREAETLHAQAIEQKDSGAAVEALRVKDQLRDGLSQLKGHRAQVANGAQTRQQQVDPRNTPDPRVAARAREWASENRDWFDPQGGDEASAIAYAIERRVFNEGRFDPTSDEYWDEVDRRIAKRVPEAAGRADDDEDEREERSNRRGAARRNGNGNGNGNGQRQPSGPTFRTGGRERALRRGEVYIDAERRAAMEEAGVWEDPVLRERYLRQYQKFDREHGRRH